MGVLTLDVGYSLPVSYKDDCGAFVKSHRTSPLIPGDFKINTRKANVVDQIRLLEPLLFPYEDAIPRKPA